MTRCRRKHRTDERGAALFIVVMVVVLLSAIGIFAVRTSSLVETAAGYSRRAEQAMYIGEFALRSVAADMAGKEDSYRQCIAGGGNECRATRNLASVLPAGAPVACCWKEDDQIIASLQNATTPVATPALAAGLFGDIVRPGQTGTTRGVFHVEMTDLGPAPNPKAGEDLSGAHFTVQQTTLTATGMIQPMPGAGNLCTAEITQSSGVASLRAHVTFLSSR